MFVKKIIGKLIEILNEDLEIARQSFQSTKSYQESADLKSEGKYDTRSIEAGYLKQAQELRVKELEGSLLFLNNFELNSIGESVQLGSIVEVEVDNKKTNFVILPVAAGKKIELENKIYQVVSPSSQLGQELIGLKIGDSFELELKDESKVYTITNIITP